VTLEAGATALEGFVARYAADLGQYLDFEWSDAEAIGIAFRGEVSRRHCNAREAEHQTPRAQQTLARSWSPWV
jgi:hypothetical protein